jgi:hypothetical protein
VMTEPSSRRRGMFSLFASTLLLVIGCDSRAQTCSIGIQVFDTEFLTPMGGVVVESALVTEPLDGDPAELIGQRGNLVGVTDEQGGSPSFAVALNRSSPFESFLSWTLSSAVLVRVQKGDETDTFVISAFRVPGDVASDEVRFGELLGLTDSGESFAVVVAPVQCP